MKNRLTQADIIFFIGLIISALSLPKYYILKYTIKDYIYFLFVFILSIYLIKVVFIFIKLVCVFFFHHILYLYFL